MRKSIAILFVFIFAFMAGCGHQPEIKISDDASGQEITLNKAQTLVVSLEGNMTTGYVWEIESFNGSLLGKKQEFESDTRNKLVGAPGVQIFRFTGIKPGKTELKIVYHRPWETNVKPAKIFTLQVTVR